MSHPAPVLGENVDTLWNNIVDRLQEEVPYESFLTWFKPLEPVSCVDGRLTIRVPNQFHSDWVESHYSHILNRLATAVLGQDTSISYEIGKSSGTKLNGRINPSQVEPAVQETETVILPSRNGQFAGSNLNERYTFDTFIEGECNKFSRAAAFACAKRPGKNPYNPLLMYGSSGLGKTHLMQAIGNYILTNKLAKRVLYVTSETFTVDFVNAIQNRSTDRFNKHYRNIDVLLLDDVHFFMSKERTQDEFFHTFNYLSHAGKQLIFTSDRPPRELIGFDKRLINRLEWGLVSELQNPDLETRLAIVNHLVGNYNISLPSDVSAYIASNVTDSIRSLEGAVTHLLARSSLLHRNINIDMAHDCLSQLITKLPQSISIERIQELTAKEFNIPADLLRSKTRKKEVVIARKVAMYLSTKHTTQTLNAIGLYFGGRDHATVIHARNSIIKILDSSSEITKIVEDISRKLFLYSI